MKLRHFFSYLNERFPLVNMALFAILFSTVYSIVTLNQSQNPIGWRELVGVFAVISFFFRLRVFDEIKDYQIDAINHPDRVLQSGKIDLRTLKIISALGFVLEVAWSIMMGNNAIIGYTITFLYSVLMLYEFFIGHWLKKKLILYAITHMMVMPMIIAWIWLAYDELPAFNFFILASLSVLAGFSFEIARKVHEPSAEKDTVDSYSKVIGLTRAILLVLGLLFVGLGCQFYLLQEIDSSIWSYILMALLYMVLLVYYLKQFKSSSERQLRKLEIGVSLFMLVSYLSIIVETQI